MKITICSETRAMAATGTWSRKAKRGESARETAAKRDPCPRVILGSGRPSATSAALRSWTPDGIRETTNAALRRAASDVKVAR
jgi:hypothetical protein